MFLSNLSLINYKNISEANLDFCRGINCFVGNNGVGKTNLLDAVYYLSFCKSHSNSIDNQNIRHEENFLMVQGKYFRGEMQEDIYLGLKRGQRKAFKHNKKEYERISDHIGLLPLVLVSPNDSCLIDGGSDERRKFIDGVISQYDKKYLDSLIRYNRVVQQRNALLKNDDNQDMSIFDVCEWQMEQFAQYIYEKRKSFIEEFVPIFQEYYQFISSGKEIVNITYKSHLQKPDFKTQLESTRQRDFILGFTSKGIHKDELEMFLGDYLVKRIGSQGQGKSFLIALKLAQFDFLKKVHGFFPLLLLDDIFDKLDSQRVTQIIQLVSGEKFGQIFITDTNREHLDELLKQINNPYKIFTVKENGVFLE